MNPGKRRRVSVDARPSRAPHKCSECDFVGSRKGKVDEHIQKTNHSKPATAVPLPQESAATPSASTPENAVSIHGGQEPTGGPQRPNKVKQPHKCSECSYVGARKERVVAHIKKAGHPATAVAVYINPDPGATPSRQPPGGAGGAAEEERKKKAFAAKQPHECSLCGTSGARKESVDAHIRRAHVGVSPPPVAIRLLSHAEGVCAQGGGSQQGPSPDVDVPAGLEIGQERPLLPGDPPVGPGSQDPNVIGMDALSESDIEDGGETRPQIPQSSVGPAGATRRVDLGAFGVEGPQHGVARGDQCDWGNIHFQQRVVADLSIIKDALGVRRSVEDDPHPPPSAMEEISDRLPWLEKVVLAEGGVLGGEDAGDVECWSCKLCKIPFSRLNAERTLGRLWYAIQRHADTQKHKEAASKERRDAERIDAVAKMQADAAYNVGLQYLHGIHEADSARRMEREIALQAARGVAVGDLNHSRKLYARMTTNFFNVMADDLRSFFTSPTKRTGERPAISVACDKLTTGRRTVLLVAISAIFDGEIRAFAAQFQLCGSSLNGDAMVQLIKKSMEPFCGIPEQFGPVVSSFPCDGELRAKLIPALGRAGWPHLDTDGAGWVTVPWDQAHLLELGRKDAAASDIVADWLDHLVSLTKEINKKYQRGKQYELLLEARDSLQKMAEEHAADCESRTERWMKTHNFSDTRWASFEGRAFQAIVRIFPAMVHMLETEATARTPVTNVPTATSMLAQSFMEKVSDLKYVVSLLGIADVSARVGKLSESLQSVNIAPWCRDAETRLALGDLRADARAIRAFCAGVQSIDADGVVIPSGPDGKRLPLLAELLARVGSADEAPSFRGVALAYQEPTENLDAAGPRVAMMESLLSVAEWIDALTKCVAERLGEPHWIVAQAGVAFSPHVLLSTDVKKGELDALHELLARCPFDLQTGRSTAEYIGLRTTLAAKAVGGKWRVGGTQKVDHRALYKSILTDGEVYAGHRGVIHLLEHLMLKAGVESACESMASVVKQHSTFAKSHELTAMEVCVHWNTPPAVSPGVERLVRRATEGINFVRAAQRGLAEFDVSKVVDRVRAPHPLAALYEENTEELEE